MHDDVGVESGDQLHDAIVIAHRREVKFGPLQTAPRRVGIDAEQIPDPVFLFEEQGNARPKIAPHPADEHPPSCHLATLATSALLSVARRTR
jgi:hypothetical protein